MGTSLLGFVAVATPLPSEVEGLETETKYTEDGSWQMEQKIHCWLLLHLGSLQSNVVLSTQNACTVGDQSQKSAGIHIVSVCVCV